MRMYELSTVNEKVAITSNFATEKKSPKELFSLPIYSNLKISYDLKYKAIWIEALHIERPSYTIELLQDYNHFFNWIKQECLKWPDQDNLPIKFVITTSATPGIYNLGGDLPLFTSLIEKKDKDTLSYYARLCIEAQFSSFNSYDLPIINIALLEGGALGGGLEFALTHDLIFAVESAKVGFPESRFNLFAGMGAYSILGRKLPQSQLNDVILSGKLFSTIEFKELGLIDSILDKNRQERIPSKLLEDLSQNFSKYISHFKVSREISPLSYKELEKIAEYWVHSALHLKPENLKKMNAIGRAQDRKLAGNTKNDYVLPATEQETKRLSAQASIFEERTKFLLENVGVGKGMSCLDIGCGPGDVMEILGDFVGRTGRVTGTDINVEVGQASLERLRKLNTSQYDFFAGNILEQDLSGLGEFDLVFARFLLLHLSDPVGAIKKMWNALKPGGVLLAMDYDFRSMGCQPKHRVIEELTKIISGVFSKTGLDPHIGSNLPALFEKAGLEKLEGIDVYNDLLPISKVHHVLVATLAGFLPAAYKLGIIDQDKGKELMIELEKLKLENHIFFLLPMVVGCWGRKNA